MSESFWDEIRETATRDPTTKVGIGNGKPGRPRELKQNNRWVRSGQSGQSNQLEQFDYNTIETVNTMAKNDTVSNLSNLDFNKGRLYGTTPTKQSPSLSIPAGGMTDREAQLRIKQLGNIKNAWDVLGTEYDVETAIHTTHQKMIGAKTAEVNATVAAVQLETSFLNLETAQAQGQQAELQRNFEIAKIPVMQKQFELNFNSLVLQTEQLALSAQKLNEDVEFFGDMLQLDGYDVESLLSGTPSQPLSLPAFTKPDFSNLSMKQPASVKEST